MDKQSTHQKNPAAPTRSHPTKNSVKSPERQEDDLQGAIGNRQMGLLMDTHPHISPSSLNATMEGEMPMLGDMMPVSSGTIQRQPLFGGLSQELAATQDVESGRLRESRFRHDFSQVGIDRGGLPPIQAKLTIGAPNDKYEQEADRVASQVVQQINAPVSVQSSQGQPVQRTEAPEEEEIQAKPEITSLQRKGAIAGGEASTDLDTAINSAKSSGQPLEAGLQRSMGQAMGADFSGVKVHTDAQSDQLNQSIQAKAFTTGQDVFFRQGAYDPGSRGGQELLAHELTHVVQQKGAAVQSSKHIGNTSKLSATEKPECNTQIQRTIIIGKEEKSRDKDVKQVWEKFIKGEKAELGDRKIIENLIRLAPPPIECTSWEKFVELVVAKREPKESLKRKRNDKPENNLPRVRDRAVGMNVDWNTHRVFRPERRLRRLVKKQGRDIAGRNVYMVKRRKLDNSGFFKIITVSHPAGQVARSEVNKPIDQLMAKYNTGHSENITDVIESSDWDMMKNSQRVKEATTREQCKDCRYNYPSKVEKENHFFGFPYSAPEDHIDGKNSLYMKLKNNNGHVHKGMTKEEKALFHQAAASATNARQNEQKTKLEEAQKNLSKENSEDEYESDNDEWYVDQSLAELLGIEGGYIIIGKAKVTPIPLTWQMKGGEEENNLKEWVMKQIDKRKKENEAEAEDGNEAEAEDGDDERENEERDKKRRKFGKKINKEQQQESVQ
ncbi:DUF4157 domain-containing protein [Microcoleus sp. D3_18_C4]|uniref:DUF4157 domain-containing protein n=1 Tax=Microcoleus sp. D3_18_C4 TaxID=3055335 RepID=UPI002FD2A95C